MPVKVRGPLTSSSRLVPFLCRFTRATATEGRFVARESEPESDSSEDGRGGGGGSGSLSILVLVYGKARWEVKEEWALATRFVSFF